MGILSALRQWYLKSVLFDVFWILLNVNTIYLKSVLLLYLTFNVTFIFMIVGIPGDDVFWVRGGQIGFSECGAFALPI